MQGAGNHTQVHSFVTSWGYEQLKEAVQDHWLVDYSAVSAFEASAIVTKMQAVQVGTMEQFIRRARGQAQVWILLCSLYHRIKAIVHPEDSYMPYKRNYCNIASLVAFPRINPYVDMLIWSYPSAGNIYATFCLSFARILLYIILKISHLCQMIHEDDRITLLVHLLPKLMAILAKMCIL